jgi:hypothetical protein
MIHEPKVEIDRKLQQSGNQQSAINNQQSTINIH